jgi:uncharacterized membrane protein YfbV (UPF0208 family)
MGVSGDLTYRLRLLRACVLRRSANLAVPALDRIRTAFSPSLWDAEAYIRKAQKLSGSDQFLCPALPEALTILLSSIRANNKLNTIGQAGLRNDIQRLLINHLLLSAARQETPDLARREMVSPVFIMGLPRTASTFLHSVLILDKRHRAPTMAEVTYPSFSLGTDAESSERMRRALYWLDVLEPDFQNAYPAQPDSPQECSEILSNTLESLRFDSTYDVPEYLTWMDKRSHRDAYAYHRLFLQSLETSSPPRRWILKCPDHVFYYEDLLQIYPDARIIVTHRDPGRVLPSVASLTMILQGLFSDRVEPERVAQRVLERWVIGAQRVIEIAESRHARSGKVLHVFYDDLVREPLSTLTRIYQFLETPFDDHLANRIRDHLNRPGGGSYRSNRFSEQFQKLLPVDMVRERFQQYLIRFDLPIHKSTTAQHDGLSERV